MNENWRTAVDAQDYLGQQKKKIETEQRRPVMRRASDLVGPGIAPGAVMVTDWNDKLATYNGYYSSGNASGIYPGASAANGPQLDVVHGSLDFHPYTATVVSDPVLGGRQILTDLITGVEYKRTFLRNPSDASFLIFGAWTTAPAPYTPTLNIQHASTSVTIAGVGRINFPVAYPVGTIPNVLLTSGSGYSLFFTYGSGQEPDRTGFGFWTADQAGALIGTGTTIVNWVAIGVF